MKCSNCGAEVSNLSMNWGKKQTLLTLLIMLLGFLPLIKMTLFKGDATKDLTISEVTTRMVGKSLEIVGVITNTSNRQWTSVTVEAEFFDASGKFLDEESDYLRSDIGAKAREHFKISVASPPEGATGDSVKTVLKIAGGHTSAF